MLQEIIDRESISNETSNTIKLRLRKLGRKTAILIEDKQEWFVFIYYFC